MAADIYTKGFTDTRKWDHVRRLINVYAPYELQTMGVIVVTGGLLTANGEPLCTAAADLAPAEEWVYTIVHACCEHQSLMCSPTKYNHGVRMVEITKEQDFNSAQISGPCCCNSDQK